MSIKRGFTYAFGAFFGWHLARLLWTAILLGLGYLGFKVFEHWDKWEIYFK